MIVARIVIKGVVQGVGFRWRVQRAARAKKLGGFVRNLPDGSVEVYASAPSETELKEFVKQITARNTARNAGLGFGPLVKETRVFRKGEKEFGNPGELPEEFEIRFD